MKQEKYGLKLRIRYTDKHEEQMVIEASRLLLGSGAHCDIRLPNSIAATEHVLITLVEQEVRARPLTSDSPPALNGVPFNTEVVVPPGAILSIGSVQVWSVYTLLDTGANARGGGAEKASPLAFVALLLGLPIAAYLFFMKTGDSQTVESSPEPPPLWRGEISSCPQTSADQALVVALDKRMLAEGKRERRPFFVQDGVQAVPLFEMASACFRIAGRLDEAEETMQAAKDLRTALNEDYRAHQMRLYHALSVSDANLAQKEVQALFALTELQTGPYMLWLNALNRRLQLQVSKNKQEGT